jgi:hypothetical protein
MRFQSVGFDGSDCAGIEKSAGTAIFCVWAAAALLIAIAANVIRLDTVDFMLGSFLDDNNVRYES